MELILKAFSVLTGDSERRGLIKALMSPSEIRNLEGRIHVIKLLLEGKTQREARVESGSSIATVSRAAREIVVSGHILKLLHERLSDDPSVPKLNSAGDRGFPNKKRVRATLEE
jgi:uncharacterized protein YerC